MSASSVPLTPAAAARVCGLSVSYLARLRQDGDKRRPGLPDGPRCRRIGRKVVYLQADVERWLENLPSVKAADAPRRGRPTKAVEIARRRRDNI